MFRDGKSICEITLGIIANAAIGIGLVVEYDSIRKTIVASGELQRDSDAKLKEAVDRASKAQEELVKYLTPRRLLIGPHKKAFVNALLPFTKTPFDVGFGEGDGEQADIAWDLEKLLTDAGWAELPWGVHAVGVAVIQRNGRPIAGSVAAQNIEIHLDPSARQALLPAAQALVAFLNGVEIKVSIVPINIANTNTHAMHVLVGPKR